ncbi:MAG: ArsB/NhaD family transporter [Gammaproteobacteria bacterium]|nr:ArsB/NhaD family transporter [Gammaproteobacteria bacterium]
MNQSHQDQISTIFGLDPVILSCSILVITFIVLFSERFNRTVIALIGACIVIISGILTQEQAIAGIDFNTLALLAGMMVIVAVTRQTGLFEYISIWAVHLVKGDPRGVLIVLSLVTALFSAFLDNLTTVLLVVPIALLIAEKLKVSPYPFLISQILASNIGGTATLIGDPPNILIGSATGYSFMDFLVNLGPVVLILLVLTTLFFYFYLGRSLQTSQENRDRVMRFRPADSIQDIALLKVSLMVISAVIAGFIFGEHYEIRPGTIAIFGAAVLLLLSDFSKSSQEQGRRMRKAFAEVEWGALFFFMGLFVLVHGVEHTGLLQMLGEEMIQLTEGDPQITAFSVLWLAALASAAIDNIPFVTTMIPLVESMESSLGGPDAVEPVWWSLALGACLGGNGSLIGAAANVMVAGLGERAGYPLSFMTFIKIGMPIMLFSVLVANVYIYVVYF